MRSFAQLAIPLNLLGAVWIAAQALGQDDDITVLTIVRQGSSA
jgi:hypothetical protein